MEERLKLLSRAMQAGMVVVALAGGLTGNVTSVFAATVALILTEIPSIVRRDLRLVLPVELNFWIVLALFLHVVGGFSGFYDTIPWWDHVTHAMSASLVAALGFVSVVILDKYVDSIYLPRPFLAFIIVMFTMAMGVSWEILEYVSDKVMGTRLQYSLEDTMLDLLFDAFAGLVVAIFGTYYLTRTSPGHFIESMKVEEAKVRVKEVLRKPKKSSGQD